MYEAVTCRSPVSYIACTAVQMGQLSDGEATTQPFCELRALSPPRSVTVSLSSAKLETIHQSCATISTLSTLSYHLEPCRHNRGNRTTLVFFHRGVKAVLSVSEPSLQPQLSVCIITS